MIDKFKKYVNRYDELTGELSDPAIINSNKYLSIVKEHSELEPIVSAFEEFEKTSKEYEENKQMLTASDDQEFRDMVKEELSIQENRLEELDNLLKDLIAPKDPKDDRNVIVEIRGGAGGDEAALFAGVLYKMYSYYAGLKGWSTEVIDCNETELGGYKEIVFSINGKGAYSRLKYERGVHRVQRVPTTESGGRVHTSTVTVAVLPEAQDVEVDINPTDLEIDTYRASGAGGQHVNTTDSAIRITHKPTGLVVTCQDQRSQHKNRDKAMRVLKSRLLEQAQNQQAGATADDRKSQVGTGDRSERIRTYNYPQGRITDHRIGLTLYKIDQILSGDLDDVIDPLIAAERANSLGKEGLEE